MRSAFIPLLRAARLAPAAAASLLLSACATPPEPAQGAALFPGVSYLQRTEAGEAPRRLHIVAIDLKTKGLAFAVTPADTSQGMEHVAHLTTRYLAERHAQLAINGSYFLPFKGGKKGGDDYYPHEGQPVNVSGATLAAGRQVSPVETDLDKRVDAIVCFSKARVEIRDGQICGPGFTDGVAAGPRLLRDGRTPTLAADYATGRHPRTAIGVSADRTRAWIVVVDGRQTDSVGATLPELAEVFHGLGASDAINLDGGGSSTLAVEGADGAPRLLNTPIHTGVPGRERPVANHILLFARKP